jgi:FAD-linked sulfhydryl oxidase
MYARISNLHNKTINMTISSSTEGSSYSSNAFGPALWFTLHNAASAYPDFPDINTQRAMKNLLISLPLLIPCLICKTHWKENLKRYNLDIVVSTRLNLFTFLVYAHNNVNKINNKREISVEDAKDLYGYDKPEGSTIRLNYYV